jgi:dTDP-4-dehydrorhamnose reductase
MAGRPAILVTGGTGQVGTELLARAPADLELQAPPRAELDLSDPDSIASAFAARPYAAVINAGAYTAVDRAESDVVTAWTVNALAPAALAAATAKAGVPIVQVSTDYVFDGSKPEPYVETDPVGPLGVYGASKLAGELAVRTANPRHVILRTAWVFSPYGSNFVKTMLRVGAERPLLRVVNDQHGCPTAAGDIADALLTITRRLLEDETAPTGTYHYVGAGEATWWAFAKEIFAVAAEHGRTPPEVEPITTAQYPTPARRPANSRLDKAKIERDFGINPRPWRDATRTVVGQLLA